jgi:hypothetical protein
MKKLKNPKSIGDDYIRIQTGANIHLKTERKLLNRLGLKGYEFFSIFEGDKHRIYHFRKSKKFKTPPTNK